MKNIIEEKYTPPFASYKHQLGYYVVRPLNWCGIWKQDEKTGEMLIGACNSMLRVDSKEEAELIANTFNRFFDLLKENKKIEHQKKIIDRLSRKIQRKNQEYRKLKSRKMPPTLFGREVIIVPDSKVKDIMIVSKDIFDIGDLK